MKKMESGISRCVCNLCGQHFEFPDELTGTDQVCPQCGVTTRLYSAPTVSPPRRRWWFIGSGAIVLVSLAIIAPFLYRAACAADFGQLKEVTAGIIGICALAILAVASVVIGLFWLVFPFIVYNGFNAIDKRLVQIERRVILIEPNTDRIPKP
jgi:hypothetical protein